MVHVFNNGSKLDFTQEHLGRVDLEALLTTLAKESRAANQTPWSVLQHLMAVGIAAEMLYQGNVPLIQKAYTHDFHEAITRDIPTPYKDLIGPAYYEAEKYIDNKLMAALRLPTRLGDEDQKLFRDLDKTVGYVEALVFFDEEVADLYYPGLDVSPHLVHVCTLAQARAASIPITVGGNLNPEIVAMFRDVINATVE